MDHTLRISNLHVSIENKQILNGVDLCVRSGEIHAVMGPNGSGKSTLAYALMGHPQYKVLRNYPIQPILSSSGLTRGSSLEQRLDSRLRGNDGRNSLMLLNGKDISDLPTQERAKAGLFLALQSPIAIPGVHVMNLLRTAYQELHARDEKNSPKKQQVHNPLFDRAGKANSRDIVAFHNMIKEYARSLHIDDSFLGRGIHDGFSGGEKKKMEMLQALVLSPKFAIFDEIDTGLDVDALHIVSDGMNRLAKSGTGIIIITHYQRILKYLQPDVVHVLVNGKIVKTGTSSLAKDIEEHGYKSYLP